MIQPRPARAWYPRGEKAVQDFNFSHDRFYAFGALGIGVFHYSFFEKMNQRNFLAFVARLLRRHGKLLLFFDNAKWHTGRRCRRFFEKHKGRICVVTFPAYTPELNPIEQKWKRMKNSASNRLFKNGDELKAHLRRHSRGEKNLVKMFQYLCP